MKYFIQYGKNGNVIQKMSYNGPGNGPADFTECTLETFQNASMVKKETYADKRRAEYPSIGDQLDALWKGGMEKIAMQRKILAIKSKYPKGV